MEMFSYLNIPFCSVVRAHLHEKGPIMQWLGGFTSPLHLWQPFSFNYYILKLHFNWVKTPHKLLFARHADTSVKYLPTH